MINMKRLESFELESRSWANNIPTLKIGGDWAITQLTLSFENGEITLYNIHNIVFNYYGLSSANSIYRAIDKYLVDFNCEVNRTDLKDYCILRIKTEGETEVEITADRITGIKPDESSQTWTTDISFDKAELLFACDTKNPITEHLIHTAVVIPHLYGAVWTDSYSGWADPSKDYSEDIWIIDIRDYLGVFDALESAEAIGAELYVAPTMARYYDAIKRLYEEINIDDITDEQQDRIKATIFMAVMATAEL